MGLPLCAGAGKEVSAMTEARFWQAIAFLVAMVLGLVGLTLLAQGIQ